MFHFPNPCWSFRAYWCDSDAQTQGSSAMWDAPGHPAWQFSHRLSRLSNPRGCPAGISNWGAAFSFRCSSGCLQGSYRLDLDAHTWASGATTAAESQPSFHECYSTVDVDGILQVWSTRCLLSWAVELNPSFPLTVKGALATYMGTCAYRCLNLKQSPTLHTVTPTCWFSTVSKAKPHFTA